MSRYAAMFDRLGPSAGSGQAEGAFGAFLMLGDPDLSTCSELMDQAIESGADMIEVGIPFSDPVADGPVIQAAAQRALAGGVRVGDCLELNTALRERHTDVPIGILTYANIVARPGFIREAAEAGADSLLIADIPALEAEPFAREMDQAGIEPVLIAAANTPDATLDRIASLSKAYTYCVSRTGITGIHAGGQFDSGLINRVNKAGAPPAVFGFGISTPAHVRSALAAGAKGVICGSAIVEKVGLGEDITLLIRSLKAATRERLGAAMN